MTLASSVGLGLIYPSHVCTRSAQGVSRVVDATDERIALIGHVFIAGRPASAKTISAAGGGTISFRTGAVTFAATGPSSTVVFGLQDVDPAAGPTARPDGTFDVSKTYTSGTDAIGANAWVTAAMDTGTKSITHGDLIAIVMDMTARNGADTVSWATAQIGVPARPMTNVFLAGAWQTTGINDLQLAYITFDDGALGTLQFFQDIVFAINASEAWADATNPDERGHIFQVPWGCKIEGFVGMFSGAAAGADFDVKLYSDPLGTPSLMTSVVVLGEQMTSVGSPRQITLLLPSEIALSRNTDYCLAIKGTGASNVQVGISTLAVEGLRTFLSGGMAFKKATRNNSTGAFAAESPAVTIYNLGVLISQFDDGMGAGRPTYALGG